MLVGAPQSPVTMESSPVDSPSWPFGTPWPRASAVDNVGVFGVPAVAEHNVSYWAPPHRAVDPAWPPDDDVAREKPLVRNADRLAEYHFAVVGGPTREACS